MWAIQKRLDPSRDEYEEDIIPAQFCLEIKACDGVNKSMDRSMDEAAARRERGGDEL